MSLYRDRQIRGFCFFLIFFMSLMLCTGLIFAVSQTDRVKNMYHMRDEAVASSLLEQGVSKDVVAAALTNTERSEAGRALLTAAGIGRQTETRLLPFLCQFRRFSLCALLFATAFFTLVLAAGTLLFFWKRKRLYLQADQVLTGYINGDYSGHLPQNREGAVFQIFSSVEQLATMLRSKGETEHQTKEFLKETVSDISHQLKTPLAALMMYQEIIEAEPENQDTVKRFSAKMGISLKRMEQLILSMLKITRLDSGAIIFEKSRCCVAELIACAVEELTTRAGQENKEILLIGDRNQFLVCDKEWTGEAIGNIVKNALDHTESGETIRITWEKTPLMLQISIADHGHGIAQEDIYHIFKRFYRSKHSSDRQGVGLGLPLAKSIIEGQGGSLSVQSDVHVGTTFTISFLTES